MTALTLARRPHNPLSPWVIILPLLLLGIALVAPAVSTSLHDSMHLESEQIRICFNNPDNWEARMTYLDLKNGLQRDNFLCKLPDGRIGDRVVQWCKNSGWRGVTAYIIGDGTLAEAINTLAAKGCQMVWRK